MNNKGYIFIETIVVLSITMVSLLVLFNGYSLLTKSAYQKKYFDNINDVYKVNIIKNMMKENNNVSFVKTECTNFMNEDCTSVLDKFNIERVILTDNLESINTTNDNFIKYLNTLEKDKKYIIIERKLNNKYYYASLKIKEGDKSE